MLVQSDHVILFNASILKTGQGEVLVLAASKEGSLIDVGREPIESEKPKLWSTDISQGHTF